MTKQLSMNLSISGLVDIRHPVDVSQHDAEETMRIAFKQLMNKIVSCPKSGVRAQLRHPDVMCEERSIQNVYLSSHEPGNENVIAQLSIFVDSHRLRIVAHDPVQHTDRTIASVSFEEGNLTASLFSNHVIDEKHVRSAQLAIPDCCLTRH